VTCTSTSGVFAGATITGTNIPANSVVNRVVDSTTLELNAVTTATGSGYTFTVYNPYQSQWTTTITVGDGTNGNTVPTGAKVRIPNIMFSDATAANLISASHAVNAYINMANGGVIDARICLFGLTYVNFAQAASVYLRNVGFTYQWALSECYAVDMDYIGNAASPMVWYYSAQWLIRDPRYGILPPFGYTASSVSSNVALSYIHNALIKNWHKVYYCPAYFTGTTVLQPIDLSYTDDAVFENIRSVALNATRLIKCFNITNRVYRSTFTNLELYGTAPFGLTTSDNNTFTGIEYCINLFKPIKSFKSAMRLSENAAGTLLSDNVPVYLKTRTFFGWVSREDQYFESGEYSATPFQNNWLFPDLISVRPTESVPASVTFNWTQREPTAASTTAYEIHRSTSQGFTTRDTSTAVFRVATPATVTFANGPRTSSVSTAARIFTFAVAKTITASGTPGSFLTDGHAVGDVVDISGSASNDGTYTINTLTATVMTVNETLVAEVGDASPVITIAGRPPVVDTKYYYRMRKFHSITAHVDCSVASGSTTMTCTNVNTNWGFDRLYASNDWYFETGSYKIRNRKYVLFNTPYYVGATITGTGIPAATTITSIDADSQTIGISNATTVAAENVTITLPVQAGMAVALLINRPGAGLPYGTTVASVESATSLTLSQAATADYGYLSNGTFTGDASGWTLTAGWAYGSNAVAHTAGTTTLSATTLNIVIGGVYTLTFTISGMSAGTVTATLGGVAGTARSANGTYIQAFTATTTGTLIFTPTTTFNGTIDDVSIGLTTSFLPFTESPEFVVTPHDYTSATNLCLQSRTLATTWLASGITATNANTYQAPSELTWATPATSTSLLSTASPGTVTQTITGLTIGEFYSAAIWIRANQTQALPNGVAGNFTWAGTTTAFTANYKWQRIKIENVQASATSHTIIISITTTGQTMWATDAMVNLGTTVNTGNIVTTTAAVTLKPRAIPITTLYSYNRPAIMTGSTGHQGIHLTFGSAPTGSYYHEVYLSTTSGFTPSDSTLVARTWAVDDSSPFPISGSNYNNFSDITRLPYGGSSTAGVGVLYLTASSSNNAFVNVDIDYDYCNTTGVPALHLVTPAQNNVFHNINFGRVANYLAVSCLWHNTAVNSVTGNRVQNIFAKHRDLGFNDQTLAGKFKGIASANAFPVINGTTYLLGTSGIDDSNVAKAQAYGSMFNEFYFGNGLGALHIVFEDTQGVKPYTTTGTPRFSNTGRLYLPTINDTITITWPWKIKGVTGFQNVMRRLNGADFGNNATILDGLKLEYKINNFSDITRLPYGGSSTAGVGVLYLTASSSNNAFVNVDIDYDYCNTTGVPALHLVTPAQNNVFHNINFGRVANYLAVSCLWHNTAVNSVTGNRVQNIFAKHRDLGFNDQTLAGKFKGIASANAFPVINGTTYLLGTSGIDDSNVAKAQAYGSMFNEFYFGNGLGALHIVFEDTQGVKPYTTTGTPRFSNTGRLYLPTINDTITITWPWKIKGVTGFQNVMRRLNGADFGNNATILDGLKLEYKINNYATWKRLKGTFLADEGALDATNGFDLQIRLTPFTFMKFSTQPTGTYTSHTTASPGVITTNATTWATGQKVLYTTTGAPFGGLTNETEYYLIVVSTTTFQLSLTQGGAGIALTADTGSGVHTFNVLFQVGETILGALSFATAVVDEVYYDSITAGTLILSSVTGSWVAGENIRTGDNKATKALNVATNGFALGPSYTSYINALQISTTVDETKLYDAAIVTVTLTNIVPGSLYYIYDTNTSVQIATGTATGTPDPGETTINYDVSVVYEADFDITVNVRKSSAPVKYLPYSTGSTVTSSGASVFIAQVIDTVVLDSYAAIAADWTIDLTYETIKHTSGTTVYSVNHLYSYLLDYFDELGFLDDQIPMSASTPTEYNLINGWFINDASFQYLTGGAITTVGQNTEVYALTFQSGGYTSAVAGDLTKLVVNGGSTHTGRLLDYDNTRRIWWVRKVLSTFTAEAVTITSGTGAGTTTSVATGESIWGNIYTLGTIVSGTNLDVYQNDVQITPWWSANHIDILVKTKESGVEIDSGNLTVLARIYGSLYDHFVIDASSGRSPVPLAAFSDGNNQTIEATVAAYSGITFNFGASSHDVGGGPAPYDVEIDGGGNTLLQIYEYLKYVTRSGSSTTLNGVNGEYYVAVGDIRFNYDNEAVANFTQGERINANGGNSIFGYLVSLIDNGTTGTMVLRNTHGTFTNNMALAGVTSTATAQVDGTVTSITPSKTAPFGTYAGGTFFGARGVWLSNVAPADSNNFQLTDSTGAGQTPPVTIAVTVNGIVSGDKVSVFRATDTAGTIDRTYMTSHNTANTAGLSTFQVNAIPADTPTSGRLRIRNSAGTTEYHLRYSNWTGTTFTLRTAVTGTITAIDDVTGKTFYDTNASLNTILPGDLINNTTDGSWAQIITVTNTGGDDYVFTHSALSGGSDNEWDVSDNYSFHTLPIGFNNTFTAYVPYLDLTATSTTASVNVTYVSDRFISTQVRKKGIIPFTTNAVQLISTGYTATAVRTTDSIVT